MSKTAQSAILILILIASLPESALASDSTNQKARIAAFKKISGGPFKAFQLDGHARLISKDRLKSAQLQYLAAQEKSAQARKQLILGRKEVKNLQAKAAESCKTSTGNKCQKARSDIGIKALESLSNAATAAIEELNKAVNKIDQSEDLTDDEAESLKARLQQRIEQLKELRDSASATDGKPTPQSATDLTKKANIALSSATTAIYLSNEAIALAQIGSAISTTRGLEDRLTNLLSIASKNGKRLHAVETMKDSMLNHLDEASQAYIESKSRFDSGDIDEGRTRSKEAKASLSKAHGLVREIYRELKSAGLDKELSKTDDPLRNNKISGV